MGSGCEVHDDSQMFASIGVSSASITGFTWTYEMKNPDVISPLGKIYWVLTESDISSLEANEIMSGTNAVHTNCKGQEAQVDCKLHEIFLTASFES